MNGIHGLFLDVEFQASGKSQDCGALPAEGQPVHERLWHGLAALRRGHARAQV